MKSLNTVIEVLEACQNGTIECFECPMRHETECEVKSVALAYLKEYQSTKDEDNQVLTWEQLKQMEGKPVWYEHEFWKGWIILGKAEQGVNCEMIPDREERWYIVKDGSTKAYRKERK